MVWVCVSLSSCVWLESFVIVRTEEQAFFLLNYNTVIMVTICNVVKHSRNAYKYLFCCCVRMVTDFLPKGRKNRCFARAVLYCFSSSGQSSSINIKLILSPLCPTTCPCSLQAQINHHSHQKIHGERHTKF